MCKFHTRQVKRETSQEQKAINHRKLYDAKGSDLARTAADKQGKAMTVSQTELNGSADVKMIRKHRGLVEPEPGAACVLTGV